MEILRSCMEEMVKFTLKSSINNTVEFDLGLSNDFCSGLLRDPESSESFEGVPGYPLYKCLALALMRSIESGAVCWPDEKSVTIFDDTWLKKKEEEWHSLIAEKGSELVKAFKDIMYEFHVKEPLFSLVKSVSDGLIKFERRHLASEYERLVPDSLIILNKCMILKVQEVYVYSSCKEMVEDESAEKVFPGVVMSKEEDKHMSSGVDAIYVSWTDVQPCVILANLIHGLSYAGVQSLLGLSHTVGTISDALPPPRSTLLSSFILPYKPRVKGCTLTHGARALAKHADRSSDKFWGVLHGSDSDKNRRAEEVINRLVSGCRWMNVHIVPPHGAVFEIRVAEGYGARWSQDGTKFIGFLEPYMEDGHSKGWKH